MEDRLTLQGQAWGGWWVGVGWGGEAHCSATLLLPQKGTTNAHPPLPAAKHMLSLHTALCTPGIRRRGGEWEGGSLLLPMQRG